MSQITTLKNIFSLPIQAIIDADFMAARKSLEYIREFGFEPGPGKNGEEACFGKLKETSFSYTTTGESGETERRVVKIPTLSLVPLPLLHVDCADFDFSVKVIDSNQQQDKNTLNATLAPVSRDSQNNKNTPHLDANINVKMKVVQSDIPAGLSNLLALMGSNTQNYAIGKFSHQDHLIKLKKDKYAETELTLLDFNGQPVKNALVKVEFEENCGVLIACNRKRWCSGNAMLTNDEGKIRYIVAYSGNENDKPGTVRTLKFSTEDEVTVIQKLYVE